MAELTREQKIATLENYCSNHECGKCVFNFGDMCEWGTLTLCSNEELDKMLAKITPQQNDVVNHPSHYTNGGMECFDEMLLIFGKEIVACFCLCNAWKYRYRALYKNGEEDIKKSHWYMKKYKELTSDGKAV